MVSRVRNELGLSVEEFADLIGVSSDEVRNWENGVSKPDIKTERFLSGIDMKIRVYKKIRDAAGSMGFGDKYAEALEEIRQQIDAHQPEKLMNFDVDEVLIDHLSFAIADYFTQHNVDDSDISKADLAKHIYEQIKFLF